MNILKESSFEIQEEIKQLNERLLIKRNKIRQLELQQIQLNQSLESFTNLFQNVSNAMATLDKEFYFKIGNVPKVFEDFLALIYAHNFQLASISFLSEQKFE